MLGEKIGEETGRVLGQRVLPFDGQAPKMEVSFQSSGKVLGVECTGNGSYLATLRPTGGMFGEGQGILMTKDGEVLTWIGNGVGKPLGRGNAASWRGAVYYHTSSPKLARLNGLCALFEHEVDENGNVKSTIWEWK